MFSWKCSNVVLTACPKPQVTAGDFSLSAFCLGDRVMKGRRSSVAPLLHDRLNAGF